MTNPTGHTPTDMHTDQPTTDGGQTTNGAHAADNSPPPAYSTHPARTPRTPDEPQTLVEMFERAARLHPKPDTLNYKRAGEWRPIPSKELMKRARNVALGLYSLGVRRGDRVAILSESRPEWVIADAGCQFAAGVDVPIYPTQAPPQVCYILNDSGARILFIQDRAAFERVVESIRDCEALERVVFLEGEGVDEEFSLTLAELEARGRTLDAEQPNLFEKLPQAVQPDDLATIIYTSGTTGEPKGVMLTHSNLVTNLIDSAGHLAFSEHDIVLSVLPLSHVFERLGMYMYLHHGMSIYFAESLDKIGDNMREVRPTVMLCVPRLFEKIYERIKSKAAAGGRLKASMLDWAVEVGKRWARLVVEHKSVPPLLAIEHKLATRLVFSKWQEAMGGRMRLFVSGGAALPDEIGFIFMGAGLPIVQGYGLTETSPVISAGNLEDNRIGTVGLPIRSVEVRLAADGEIEVRGPNIMRGYYKKEDATQEVFTADGWFKTGDIGTIDAEGFIRITDRKKELFKTSGGKYLAPQPIEQRIKQSRFVNQVVLIGNGRKFASALIVPNWEQLRSYAQLKGLELKTPSDFCRHPRVIDLLQRQVDALTGDLSKYERVKKIAILEHELTIEGGELTPTLKIKRRVLDQKYKDVIDRMYEESSSQ